MKRIVKSILAATLLAAAASPASAQEDYQPSPEIVQSQEQFRGNRFGIFIHSSAGTVSEFSSTGAFTQCTARASGP